MVQFESVIKNYNYEVITLVGNKKKKKTGKEDSSDMAPKWQGREKYIKYFSVVEYSVITAVLNKVKCCCFFLISFSAMAPLPSKFPLAPLHHVGTVTF